MGWMRTLLLGDIGNRLDIADTENDIQDMRRARRRASSQQRDRDRAQDDRLTQLEERCEQLEVCVATLGRLLVRNGTLDEAELGAMIGRIEEADADPAPGSRTP